MPSMRMARLTAVTGITAAVAAGLGASGAVTLIDGALHHPRDEAAFQAHVVKYIGTYWDSSVPEADARDEAWARAHPEEVLAAGDAACAWLADQPVAPAVDPTGESDLFTVLDWYLDTLQPFSGPVSEIGTMTVVGSAWESLCWTDYERRTSPRSTNDD